MKSKWCFDLHLFYKQGHWTLLHVFTGHLYLFLWEFLFNSCDHFFIGVLILWGLSFFEFLVTFGILVPFQMSSWQIFPQFYGLCLESGDCFLWCAEAL
jgi:hypothetical protein